MTTCGFGPHRTHMNSSSHALCSCTSCGMNFTPNSRTSLAALAISSADPKLTLPRLSSPPSCHAKKPSSDQTPGMPPRILPRRAANGLPMRVAPLDRKAQPMWYARGHTRTGVHGLGTPLTPPRRPPFEQNLPPPRKPHPVVLLARANCEAPAEVEGYVRTSRGADFSGHNRVARMRLDEWHDVVHRASMHCGNKMLVRVQHA